MCVGFRSIISLHSAVNGSFDLTNSYVAQRNISQVGDLGACLPDFDILPTRVTKLDLDCRLSGFATRKQSEALTR